MANGNTKTANDSAFAFEVQLWAAADKMRGHRRIGTIGGGRKLW